MLYKTLLKPLLFRVDAEKAHDFTHDFAKRVTSSKTLSQLADRFYNYQSPRLHQTYWGHTFRNPIGLAAGFDKNGCLVNAMEILGMGFVEVGSITAQASCGNPKPRAFRLPKDHALINRMGLNNDGAKTVVKRLQNSSASIPVGINIAKTHDPSILGEAGIRDYIFSYKEAQKIADYITINISCPNTAEGKTFEDPAVLKELLAGIRAGKDISMIPTLVKVSPDLGRPKLEELVAICEDYGIDGYVACNTSSSRRKLKADAETLESIGRGGLSGEPLLPKSINTVRWIREAIGNHKPIMGVGGIHSFETALEMLKAGASLLQIYTGLIYEGPGLIKRINRELDRYLLQNNCSSISELKQSTV